MAAVIAVIYARCPGYKLVEIGQERKKAHGENVAQLTANWSGRGRACTHRCFLLRCVEARVRVFFTQVWVYRVTHRDCTSIKEIGTERYSVVFIGYFFSEGEALLGCHFSAGNLIWRN